jgi:hypothetical protein
MNRVLVCLTLFVAALGATPAAAATPTKIDWDLFTVVMPDQPKTNSSVVAIPSGEVSIRNWTLASDGDVYLVTIEDYPAKFVASRPAARFLEDGRTGLVNQLQGRLVSEKAIAIQGHSGTEFSITSDNGEAKARVVLVGRRVYTMFVLARGSGGAAGADNFLASLRLKPANAIGE